MGSAFFIEKTRLYKLNVPIAECSPEEIVKLAERYSKLVFVKIFANLARKLGKSCKNPFVFCSELIGRGKCCVCKVVRNVHKSKACGVPYFVREISCRFYLLVGETHIVTGRVACEKRKTESVCTAFIDYLKRIYTVSERL